MSQTTDAAHVAQASLSAVTLADAFRQTVERVPDRVALRTRGGERELNWREYGEQVDRVATAFSQMGLSRGDALGIMLTNRIEFHLADSAAMSLGVTPFSIYQTLAPEQIAHQLVDSGARAIVCETAFAEQVTEALGSAPNIEHVVIVDGELDGAMPFDDLLAVEADSALVERARDAVEPDDLLTLIYTSGTTGPPKGVELTHANLMGALQALERAVDFPDGARVVSYLPMAHIAERNTGHYLPVVLGHSVTTCPNPREVIGYLPEVKPTWFFAVPRIYEKLKAGLEAMVAGEADPQRKQALTNAIALGHEKVRLEQAGQPVPDQLAADYAKADEVVLSKLRSTLGLDQVEAIYVGAAPTPGPVLEFFHAIGVPVAELWGMSESCGCGAVNLPGKIKIGTVGQVTPGMELKIAEDGEVLMRGPEVMRGYRNLPDKTAETIDSDGWLHTGDIGELDDEGYLKIVDRKKELIITAGGKNISPANLEAKLKAHPLVGTACVIGDDRPYLTALIVLDADMAPVWAAQNGLEGQGLDEIATSPGLRAELDRAVEQLNSEVARTEGIKKYVVLGSDWLPGGDELTPTMKLKRKPIGEKYASEIDAMYGAS